MDTGDVIRLLNDEQTREVVRRAHAGSVTTVDDGNGTYTHSCVPGRGNRADALEYFATTQQHPMASVDVGGEAIDARAAVTDASKLIERQLF